MLKGFEHNTGVKLSKKTKNPTTKTTL